MLILGVLSLLTLAVFATETEDTLSLPKSLNATKYALTVNVFLPPAGPQIPDEEVFEQIASVMIDFTVKEPTRFIVLNADGINVRENFMWNGRSNYSNLPVREVKSVQKLYFEVPYTLAVGETFQFYIEYTYKLRSVNDEAFGLYRSTWVDENNVTHHIASTQFKTIHARKVVPCLDDPTFRSVWALTVNAPSWYKVDANTRKYQTTNNGQTHRFTETPSIPSYLLAFAVHDQASIDAVSPLGFKYGFIGPQEKLRHCDELIEFIGRMIDVVVYKFQVIEYPIDKLDFIQIGRMYQSGMENPGLITLEPSKFCNNNDKKASHILVTQKMLHQWFGNIVTPNGWENTIMSEGLGTYYQTRLLKKRYPNITLETLPEMGMYDDLEPPYKQPTSIEEAMNVTNPIQYSKLAIIFHMLETMIGENAFDGIVYNYLLKNKNKWGSIDDFLQIAENILNKPKDYFTNLFMPYLTRQEYPVIFVERDSQGFTLTAVLAEGDWNFKWKLDAYEQEYYVPVWYGTSMNSKARFILLQVGKQTYIRTVASPLYVNPYGNSYHRTCYANSDMWIPIAYYARSDLRWRIKTKSDFEACTRYDPSPNSEKVLSILK